MSDRATQLRRTAERQLSELTTLLSAGEPASLRNPCPGREKLGDGSIAASAQHAADNYLRIAEFISTQQATPAKLPHRMPGFAKAHGHQPPRATAGHREDQPMTDYRAENIDIKDLLNQLSVARKAIRPLADLTDQQLDAIVPAAQEMRFVDGQRTLEQIIAGLLKHQSHQIDAIGAALTV